MILYPDLNDYAGLKQEHIDWLLRSGVSIEAMVRPTAVLLAYGRIGSDGCFEQNDSGAAWLVFPDDEDVIYWQPRSGQMATWSKRAFALNEAIVDDPAIYSFDCALNVFADPLEWLRAGRDGIVIIDWQRCFSRLQDCSRIAVQESLIGHFRRQMKPAHLPEIFVLTGRKVAA